MKKTLLAAALAGLAMQAAANEFEPQIRAYLDSDIAAWVADPTIIAAVQAQNARHRGLSQSDIDALDQAWRAEVGMPLTPTIDPVLENDAARFLRDRVHASGGTITEIFAMDSHGLNVAASDVTSDYWQGDEDKFSQTFHVGPGAVHIGDVEFDESAQSYQAQVSVTLVDPATGAPVGAVTIGLNAEALF